MTLEEAIKHVEKIAEENQRIIDTGILFDNVTIDMFYCDDTEVIEEHLANYQKCAERHRQFAEWLKELKQLREQIKTGHWIDTDGDNAICGCCNRLNHLYGTYCKHCGAKMVELQESEGKDADSN